LTVSFKKPWNLLAETVVALRDVSDVSTRLSLLRGYFYSVRTILVPTAVPRSQFAMALQEHDPRAPERNRTIGAAAVWLKSPAGQSSVLNRS
jgi:hypothetical protein